MLTPEEEIERRRAKNRLYQRRFWGKLSPKAKRELRKRYNDASAFNRAMKILSTMSEEEKNAIFENYRASGT